jgi:uncharacterized protein YfaS (alpha-2-macroglobulin family)
MRAARGFSFVVLFLLAAIGWAHAQQGRQIATTENADYFGFDLRTEQNVSLDQCKAVCLGDPACRAFTYNTRAQWCFLKSDFSSLNRFAGAVAGKVVPVTGEPDIGAPGELAFVPSYIADEVARYRSDALALASPGGAGLAALVQAAEDAMAANDPRAALLNYTNALSILPDDTALWTGLSRAASTIRPNSSESSYFFQRSATGAALIGYSLSRTASQRATALAALAEGLVSRNIQRPALSAFEASLALVPSAEVQARYAEFKGRWGFRVVGHSVDSDSATPRVCVQFSEPLAKSDVDYAQFVTVNNAPTTAIEKEERQICVEGLQHGGRYQIVVRQGLPAAIDEVIAQPVALDIYVRDRSPSLRFTGDNFVLPNSARRGIPVVTVNTEVAKVAVYRVGDRSITQLLSNARFLRQLDAYEVGNIADDIGEPVWEGLLDIRSNLNQEVVTSIPIDEAIPDRKPGLYMMTAVPDGDRRDGWESRATQWFVVSDVGITTFSGEDGLNVFARSLDRATPIGGLQLQLVARNNEILGTSTTDADGRARFDAGLIRGTGGLAPAAVMADAGGGDFVFLDMTRAGFDLSDRGVAGRPTPGALDLYAWTERGIYRAGETVHAAALVRNPASEAVDDLPMTFVFLRPDGVEDRRVVSPGAALGGHAIDLELGANAMRGMWTMRIFADPKAASLSEKTFLVEDFVPDRIEFDLTADRTEMAADETVSLTVDGRYLYGAPAAGMALEGEVAIGRTREWPRYPSYVFGLQDEEDVEDALLTLEDLPQTDDAGKATFEVSLDQTPSTTQLLKARATVRMVEAGGRAVERALDIGVRPETTMLGLRPEFEGGQVAEGALASFRVIAVDPDGARAELPGIRWSLIKINRNYQWYRNGNSWNYEPITTTSLVESGTVDASPTAEPRITVPVSWGRYRLEIETRDPAGPTTSTEFDAGWYVEARSTETPEGLEIALDKETYSVGETARLQITSRFAGEALIALGAENLLATYSATVPEGGTTIDIPVTEELGAGAYVLATLYRPGQSQESRMPMRAVGVKWLKAEPGARALSVAIEAPEKTEPRKPLVLPVSIGGLAAGEEAYVTVAAVDVGILNLTRYQAPDPVSWYFGQRTLGLEMRDLYGRLIDGSLGSAGRLRTGGDGGSMVQGSPPTEKLLAFFSGIVEVDAEGRATVTFDIPQFNGTARVMAVAWSKDGTGSASKDVIIRDPVVVTASLPRFMAPSDQARLLLEIANTDGPTGEYELSVATSGGLLAQNDTTPRKLSLGAGERTSLSIPITADRPGNGRVTLALTHASGLRLERRIDLPVRPGVMPVTTRQTVNLAGNGGSLRIDGELLAASLPESASVTVSVSRATAFDVPAMLMSLDRYPYGCAEQTTSRALPLLYVSELSKTAGMEEDPALRGRVQDAIARVLSYQSSAGSFGLWSPGSGDLWLDAYVTDFLTRAREQNYPVPEQAMSQALLNLQNSLAYDVDIASNGNEIAYALYVLSRNRKASAGDLRYYSDTQLDKFASPLARAQLAASLGLYGDAQRAEATFGSAYRLAQSAPAGYTSRSDYGSKLRDGAAMLALAAEARPEPALIPRMIQYVADARRETRYMSTQDEAWMLLAARAVQGASDDIRLEVGGTAHQGAYAKRLEGAQVAASPFTLINRGDQPVDAILTTVAAPIQPLPAGGDGFTIERTYYNMDGTEANVTDARQNERYVVVLKVNEANAWPSRVLVNDLLPAGFEIDNPRIMGSAELSNFEWLGETDAVHTEFRDDRFIAAFDREQGSSRDFTLAYVVRAVTPGVFTHPAASVEDMYRPQLSARTATGLMEVRGE